MNEISMELDLEIEYDGSGEAMDLNLVEIFLTQQSRLKRIIAGMGLNTAQFETKQDGVNVFTIIVIVAQCK